MKTVASEEDPVEAGTAGLTLTCTVSKAISGLSNMPSAHWSMVSGGRVISGEDNITTVTSRNTTTVTVALTFSSLHTSHAEQYTCHGTLVSPAAEENITSTSDPISVNISCKWSLHIEGLTMSMYIVPTPTLDLSVPSGLLYEGTSQILNCTVSLPDTVDTDVKVTVQWRLATAGDRVMMSDVSSMRYPFISTLILSPLSMTDAGQYSCVATADSSSPYITTSSQGHSSEVILNVTGISIFHCIYTDFPHSFSSACS